ncbi:hypothetical protein V8E53_002588 [Lactarius tabidus]
MADSGTPDARVKLAVKTGTFLQITISLHAPTLHFIMHLLQMNLTHRHDLSSTSSLSSAQARYSTIRGEVSGAISKLGRDYMVEVGFNVELTGVDRRASLEGWQFRLVQPTTVPTQNEYDEPSSTFNALFHTPPYNMDFDGDEMNMQYVCRCYTLNNGLMDSPASPKSEETYMDIKTFEIGRSWIFDLAVLNCSEDYGLLRIHTAIRTIEGDEVQMLKLAIEGLRLELWFATAHMRKSIH